MLDLDFGAGVNMDTEDDFGDLTAMARQVPPSLDMFARTSEGLSGDIVEEIGRHTPCNIAVSPSAELLALAGFSFDSNYDWTMTINLPWFELRELLQYPGL